MPTIRMGAARLLAATFFAAAAVAAQEQASAEPITLSVIDTGGDLASTHGRRRSRGASE